jgi:hypothetical protein
MKCEWILERDGSGNSTWHRTGTVDEQLFRRERFLIMAYVMSGHAAADSNSPFRRKCHAGRPAPTDADRHGQELINEGRDVLLSLMQRS